MKQLQRIFRKIPVLDKLYSNRFSCTFVTNLLYAVWEIVCGIYNHSYWFLTLGCYYVLLTMAHWILLRKPRRKVAKWKKLRNCGVLLLFLNFVLSGIVVLAVVNESGTRYSGYFIYVVAAYTFYKVVIAIKNLISDRHSHNPVQIASKAIHFVSAVISVLSLEIAMVLEFGSDLHFFRIMTICSGTGTCLILSVTAIFMILVARRKHICCETGSIQEDESL